MLEQGDAGQEGGQVQVAGCEAAVGGPDQQDSVQRRSLRRREANTGRCEQLNGRWCPQQCKVCATWLSCVASATAGVLAPELLHVSFRARGNTVWLAATQAVGADSCCVVGVVSVWHNRDRTAASGVALAQATPACRSVPQGERAAQGAATCVGTDHV